MKKILFLSLLFAAMISMSPAKKTRIIFFGDSITNMGTNKGGYIDRIQNYLNSSGKADQYELINAGVGYDKVYDLYLRIEDDVLSKNPDIVVIFEGVNDVGHKSSGTGIEIEKFEKFYTALIKKLQAKKIKIIACTPALIGERSDNTNPQDSDLNAYTDVIRKLSGNMKFDLIDLRKTFIEYETKHNTDNKESGILTVDRIHPTDAGNQIIADEMMKALGM